VKARSETLRVVAIDTATRAGGVALAEQAPSKEVVFLAERPHDEDRRHAETLQVAIDECLEAAGVDLMEVDGFAVSIGPGSFTGLRVGLATAKGLALATGAWLIGVPTLEAFAEASREARPSKSGAVWVCLDARKSEVYSGLFGLSPGGVERWLEDTVEAPRSAAQRVGERCRLDGGGAGQVLLVGDGADRYPDAIPQAAGLAAGPERLDLENTAPVRAVARLGLELFASEGPHDTAYLAPAYLRASQAEIQLRERLSRPDRYIEKNGRPA
jgi:tRNA threonylcarbamoyladenosine biosynthesis protein TsaB